MNTVLEILKLTGKGVELGLKILAGWIGIFVICCLISITAAAWANPIAFMMICTAGYMCCAWISKFEPIKQIMRTSSLSYLGLLCTFGMMTAGFLYGVSYFSGHIR